MTAAVLDFRRERATRVFRARLRSDTAARMLVSQLEARPGSLERVAEMMAAGYDMAEARAVLEQLGYVERAETCTRCAFCRQVLDPQQHAVFEPATGRAWCGERCCARTRVVASKEIDHG